MVPHVLPCQTQCVRSCKSLVPYNCADKPANMWRRTHPLRKRRRSLLIAWICSTLLHDVVDLVALKNRQHLGNWQVKRRRVYVTRNVSSVRQRLHNESATAIATQQTTQVLISSALGWRLLVATWWCGTEGVAHCPLLRYKLLFAPALHCGCFIPCPSALAARMSVYMWGANVTSSKHNVAYGVTYSGCSDHVRMSTPEESKGSSKSAEVDGHSEGKAEGKSEGKDSGHAGLSCVSEHACATTCVNMMALSPPRRLGAENYRSPGRVCNMGGR